MSARIYLTALLAAATLFMAAGCSSLEPVYNVHDHPILTGAQKLPLDDIGRNIAVAGAPRNWRFEPIAPGQLRGNLSEGKYEATVNISYTQRAYSITIVNTVNLPQEGDEIHRRYNRWIHILEKDIENRLYVAGLEAK
jgi:hypothetical protein